METKQKVKRLSLDETWNEIAKSASESSKKLDDIIAAVDKFIENFYKNFPLFEESQAKKRRARVEKIEKLLHASLALAAKKKVLNPDFYRSVIDDNQKQIWNLATCSEWFRISLSGMYDSHRDLLDLVDRHWYLDFQRSKDYKLTCYYLSSPVHFYGKNQVSKKAIFDFSSRDKVFFSKLVKIIKSSIPKIPEEHWKKYFDMVVFDIETVNLDKITTSYKILFDSSELIRVADDSKKRDLIEPPMKLDRTKLEIFPFSVIDMLYFYRGIDEITESWIYRDDKDFDLFHFENSRYHSVFRLSPLILRRKYLNGSSGLTVLADFILIYLTDEKFLKKLFNFLDWNHRFIEYLTPYVEKLQEELENLTVSDRVTRLLKI